MKAVRPHSYHRQPVVEDVPEPTAKEPFEVVIKIGGAGVCRTDSPIIEEQWAAQSGKTFAHPIGHENPGGRARSVQPPAMWPSATRSPRRAGSPCAPRPSRRTPPRTRWPLDAGRVRWLALLVP